MTNLYQTLRDPYTKDWISTSPLTLIILVLSYFSFHQLYGTYTPANPDEEDPSFRKKWVVGKNWVIALSNGYLALEFGRVLYKGNYNLFCEPVRRKPEQPSSSSSYSFFPWIDDETNDERNRQQIEGYASVNLIYRHMQIAHLMCLYFLTRPFECLDTIVMAFRGIEFQVRPFIHHAVMLVVSWLALTYTPGGTAAVSVFINVSCHTFVYGTRLAVYYFPDTDTEIPRTDNLITTHMIVLLGISISSLILDCGFPKYGSALFVCFACMFISSWMISN